MDFYYSYIFKLMQCLQKPWIIQGISWDSDGRVSTAMGYRPYGWDLIPNKDKIFLFSTASRQTLWPTQIPIQWVLGAISPGVKQLGYEADHSPPSSAKGKNGGNISTLPHMTSWHSA
jgi:hypothetical protein